MRRVMRLPGNGAETTEGHIVDVASGNTDGYELLGEEVHSD